MLKWHRDSGKPGFKLGRRGQWRQTLRKYSKRTLRELGPRKSIKQPKLSPLYDKSFRVLHKGGKSTRAICIT